MMKHIQNWCFDKVFLTNGDWSENMQSKLIKAMLISAFAASLYVAPVMGAENNSIYSNNKEVVCQKVNKLETGWSTANVNIRKSPNTESEILDVLSFNQEISYIDYNKKWIQIKYKGKKAFVSKKYISSKECKSETYSVPSYSGYKSWMDYQMITLAGSEQKILQDEYAYTGKYGIRQINGRYCVAVGSHFTTKIGQYFDLILENGEVIPCILADQKADCDTDSDNIFTGHNGCATEFIVDADVLNYYAKRDGDISACCEEWNSPVKEIKIYQKVI